VSPHRTMHFCFGESSTHENRARLRGLARASFNRHFDKMKEAKDHRTQVAIDALLDADHIISERIRSRVTRKSISYGF
jgi:hypothetical protein